MQLVQLLHVKRLLVQRIRVHKRHKRMVMRMEMHMEMHMEIQHMEMHMVIQ